MGLELTKKKVEYWYKNYEETYAKFHLFNPIKNRLMNKAKIVNCVAMRNIGINIESVVALAHSETVTDMDGNILLWFWDKDSSHISTHGQRKGHDAAKKTYDTKYHWLYHCYIPYSGLWRIATKEEVEQHETRIDQVGHKIPFCWYGVRSYKAMRKHM